MLETVISCVSICVEYEVTCSCAPIFHVIMDTLVACILIKDELFNKLFLIRDNRLSNECNNY